jgi:hypothetical protein
MPVPPTTVLTVRLRHVFQRFLLDRRIGVCVTTGYMYPQLGLITTRPFPFPTDSENATLVFLSVDLAFTSRKALGEQDIDQQAHMMARSKALTEAGISELSLGDATGRGNSGAVALLTGPARLLNVSPVS